MINILQILPALFISISVFFVLGKCIAVAAGYRTPEGEQKTQYELVAKRFPLYTLIHRMLWGWTRLVSGLLPDSKIQLYNQKLRSAGSPGGLDGMEFLCIPPLLAVGMSVFGALLSFHIGQQMLPGALLGFLFGAVIPFARLDTAIYQRKRTILISLPYVIDLIALCMRAGQTFHGALATITREMEQSHPLRFELAYMSAKITLGASTAEALHNLAVRVDIPEVRQFVQSAVRSQEKGSTLADIFSIQASIIRTRRSQNAEQAASRAAVAMLGPLMLIFLSVFVVLLGPFGVKAFYGNLF